jgi:hypothetical protein
MGKKNNSYTASYKLKVISFAELFGNRAAERELGILESNVHYWRKQKEDQDLRKKIRIFYAPRFLSGQTRKKSAQIMRVNTVYWTELAQLRSQVAGCY